MVVKTRKACKNLDLMLKALVLLQNTSQVFKCILLHADQLVIRGTPCTIWNKVYTNRRHCLRCTHLWYRICISSPISNTPVLDQFRCNCVGFISVAVVRAATVSIAQAGALDAGEYGVKFVIVGLLWDDAVARWEHTWNIVCTTQKCRRWLGGGQVEQWTKRVMIKLPTQVCLGHTRRSWKWSPGNHHNS